MLVDLIMVVIGNVIVGLGIFCVFKKEIYFIFILIVRFGVFIILEVYFFDMLFVWKFFEGRGFLELVILFIL